MVFPDDSLYCLERLSSLFELFVLICVIDLGMNNSGITYLYFTNKAKIKQQRGLVQYIVDSSTAKLLLKYSIGVR